VYDCGALDEIVRPLTKLVLVIRWVDNWILLLCGLANFRVSLGVPFISDGLVSSAFRVLLRLLLALAV